MIQAHCQSSLTFSEFLNQKICCVCFMVLGMLPISPLMGNGRSIADYEGKSIFKLNIFSRRGKSLLLSWKFQSTLNILSCDGISSRGVISSFGNMVARSAMLSENQCLELIPMECLEKPADIQRIDHLDNK